MAIMKPPIRLLTAKDIPGALRLTQVAKWNQTAQDWKNLLEFEPYGCFGVDLDGNLVGTATAVRFEPKSGPGSLGWIGMALVDPECRRHEIDSVLLKKCLDYLRAQQVETVRLDTPLMSKHLYDQLGFVVEYALERWEGTAHKVPGAVKGPWTLGALTPADLEQLAEYDHPVFGTDRQKVLGAFIKDWPEQALAARGPKGGLMGYALARRGGSYEQIGPLVGDNAAICEALLLEQLARLAGKRVSVDLITEQAWIKPLAERCGLRHQRPFLRMAQGPHSAPGKQVKAAAIGGSELG